jgi:hypothetical protein
MEVSGHEADLHTPSWLSALLSRYVFTASYLVKHRDNSTLLPFNLLGKVKKVQEILVYLKNYVGSTDKR